MAFKLGLTNPAAPGEITQAGMLVAVSNAQGTFYPSATKPDTSALAAGFRQVGVLSSAPKLTLGRETEEVTTGVYGIAQEILFKGMTGSIECEFFGMDTLMLALGLGVTPVISTAASPTTSTSAITSDANTGNSVIAVTSAASLSVGDMVIVETSGNVASGTNMGRIASISTNTLTLDRVLRDSSVATGATVAKVVSAMLPIGGVSPAKFSYAGLIDFPDGRVGLITLPKVYSEKPLEFSMGSGSDAVKVPVAFKALGTLDNTYGVLLGKIFIFS